MTFIAAVVLAIFVLPSPWGLIAIILSGIYELGQTVLTIRWSQRRRARVGAEALAGKTARVVERCAPMGKVAVGGGNWKRAARKPRRSARRSAFRAWTA